MPLIIDPLGVDSLEYGDIKVLFSFQRPKFWRRWVRRVRDAWENSGVTLESIRHNIDYVNHLTLGEQERLLAIDAKVAQEVQLWGIEVALGRNDGFTELKS